MVERETGDTVARKHGLSFRIQLIDAALMLLGAALTIVGVVALINLVEARGDTAAARDRYEECVAAATDLMEASDYLTTQARMCVVTGDTSYADAYLEEVVDTRRRDRAVATLQRNGTNTTADEELVEALKNSNQLAERELYAMRLVVEESNVTGMPSMLQDVEVSAQDSALSPEEKRAKAQEMLLDYEYEDLKSKIIQDVDDCSTSLVDRLGAEREESIAVERRMQSILLVVLVLDAAFLAIAGIANYLLVMRPMRDHAVNIRNNEPLSVRGAVEIRNVAESYNSLYAENHRRTMLLRHQARTDSLTGLLNRGSFDQLLEHQGDDIALIEVDVDLFKEINDTYGHEMGDSVLKKVGHCLKQRFRTTDYACRIGGDEFAVILTEMGTEMRSVVSSKLESIYADLADTSDGLPCVTLSIGIAFSVTLPEGVNIYHAADEALYEAKHRGRDQYVFYESR